MQRILEGLIEHVDALRQTQEVTTENLNAILTMMKEQYAQNYEESDSSSKSGPSSPSKEVGSSPSSKSLIDGSLYSKDKDKAMKEGGSISPYSNKSCH